MLLNLSNHPCAAWPEAQLRAASHGFGSVEDLPFPAIDPEWNAEQVGALAEEYAARCTELLAGAGDESHTVHVMGELTFTFAVVARLQRAGIRCVASTSAREVMTDPAGIKRSVFRFVRFRDYPCLVS